MRAKRYYSYSVPIPANIPAAVVVTHIQTFNPFLANHEAMTHFSEVPPHPSQIADDPFFGAWDDTFRFFKASELVELAPLLTKEVNYEVLFQATPDGMRTRAAAPAGVVVRSEYTVRPRLGPSLGPTSPAGSDSTSSSATVVGEEYEIHEDMEIETNSLLMPFVSDAAVAAHRRIVSGVIEEIVKSHFGGVIRTTWQNDQDGTWRRVKP